MVIVLISRALDNTNLYTGQHCTPFFLSPKVAHFFTNIFHSRSQLADRFTTASWQNWRHYSNAIITTITTICLWLLTSNNIAENLLSMISHFNPVCYENLNFFGVCNTILNINKKKFLWKPFVVLQYFHLRDLKIFSFLLNGNQYF